MLKIQFIQLCCFILLITTPLFSQIIQFYPVADTVFISGGCMEPEIVVSVVESPAKVDSVKIWIGRNTSIWTNLPNGGEQYFEEVFFLVNDSLDILNYKLWAIPLSDWDTVDVKIPFDSSFCFFKPLFNFKLYAIRGDFVLDSLTQLMKTFRGIAVEHLTIPVKTNSLAPVYPNPFNASAIIHFELENPASANLAVFNNRGQLVATLADAEFPPGKHSLTWNAAKMSSGVYFVRLKSGEQQFFRKCLLLK